MSVKVDEFVYQFSDLVFVGHRPRGRPSTTWYIKCPECDQKHQFKKTGAKVWHTSCSQSGLEWTVTPAEYYILKPCDFSRILGS